MGALNPYLGKNKKIGVLGGTFNPVHLGHMHMAESAIEHLNLDRVVFMAAGIPPHKKLDFNTSPEDRLNMLKLAIEGNPKLFIDDYEAYMDEKAYSYLSLQRIHKALSKSSEIFFIIGADSLMQLDKWKYPEKLFAMCTFTVIPRGEYTKAQCENKIDELNKVYNGEIVYIDCKKFNMSSTKAREKNLKENLDTKVFEYIKRNGLYEKMDNTKKIQEYLKKNLKKKRYEHVIGTVKAAEKLAKVYNADVEKAKLAALLHDSAKHMDNEEVIFLSKEYGFEIDDTYSSQPELLHGAAGAYVAKHVFNIQDKEILDAITYHTVPGLNPSKMDKIISVADLIEETRNYPGVNDLRAIAEDGLDRVFLNVLERVIIHVLERDQLLHINSVLVYNNLLKEMNKSDKLEQTEGDK